MPEGGLPADCRDAGKADWRRIRVKALWKSKNIWGTVFHHVPDISDIPEVPLCDGIWKNVFAAAGGTPSLLRREAPIRNVQRFAVLQGGLVGHDAHRHETSRNPRIDDGLAVFGDG